MNSMKSALENATVKTNKTNNTKKETIVNKTCKITLTFVELGQITLEANSPAELLSLVKEYKSNFTIATVSAPVPQAVETPTPQPTQPTVPQPKQPTDPSKTWSHRGLTKVRNVAAKGEVWVRDEAAVKTADGIVVTAAVTGKGLDKASGYMFSLAERTLGWANAHRVVKPQAQK